MNMKKFLKISMISILYLLLIIFQLAFVNNYSIFNVTMNLFLVLIVVTFANYSKNVAIVYSLLTGIMLDIIYMTSGFGFYSFSYTLVGVVMYILVLNNFKDNNLSLIFLVFASSLIFELLTYGRLLFVYGVDLGILRLIFGILLLFILNIAPAIAINYILQKIKYGKRNIKGLYMN